MIVFKKIYWDNWLQKLFSFLVSIKVIIIASCFTLSSMLYLKCESLLRLGKISGDQFVSIVECNLKYLSIILGSILAVRGAIQISEVIKKNGNGANNEEREEGE